MRAIKNQCILHLYQMEIYCLSRTNDDNYNLLINYILQNHELDIQKLKIFQCKLIISIDQIELILHYNKKTKSFQCKLIIPIDQIALTLHYKNKTSILN